MVIAHKNEKGQYHLLTDHLTEVAKYGYNFGKSLDCGNIMYLIGLLHDLGKSDSRFQNYIKNDTNEKINHSSAGGKYIASLKKSDDPKECMINEIMQYVIYSHHGLFDVVGASGEYNRENVMKIRETLIDGDDYNYESQVLPFVSELNEFVQSSRNLSINEVYNLALEEFSELFDKLEPIISKKDIQTYRQEICYYLHCFVRLFLSILKEGDIYDSATWDQIDKPKRWSMSDRKSFWEDSLDSVESQAEYFANFKDDSDINKWRTSFSSELKNKSTISSSGIYRLSMPTGSGKTQASLRYAINNAHKYSKRHVYYVTAFLSVLEQNASDIRQTLPDNDDAMLEHHSNIVDDWAETEAESDKYLKQQYLLDSWDSPVVLTTMVQFFNTLYKGRASNLRRFHQLAHSVIIIDEVQSLPINILENFNLMMNFISFIMNTSVILCTATQPILDSENLTHQIQYSQEDNGELVALSDEAEKTFERVRAINLIHEGFAGNTTDEIVEELQADLATYNSALVILNTKKAVRTLYDELTHLPNVKLYYLTTNMCAMHRLDMINEIHEELDRLNNSSSDDKVIVVSTQLVEAGVDFDFDVVYRSLAGVDSLVQAAGRCNRNKRLEHGLFKLIKYAEENVSKIKEIKIAQDATRDGLVSSSDKELVLSSLKDNYYKKLFATGKRDGFEWVIKVAGKDEKMLDLLGYNDPMRKYSRGELSNEWLAQSFGTVSQGFNLIRQESISIIAPYKNEDLIFELKEAINNYDLPGIKLILKKLQPYTISVHKSQEIEMEQYCEIFKDDQIGIDIKILHDQYYDKSVGMTTEELELFMF